MTNESPEPIETPAPAETPRDLPRDAPEPTDLSIAFTPRQILGGFALLAALVMLLRRKRREPDRGEPD